MKHGYTYEKARVTGGPRIETQARNTVEDFGRASVGIVERRGRTKNPVSDSVRPALEEDGTSCFGGEEGEIVPVGKNDALLILKGIVHNHEGRTCLYPPCSLAYVQNSDVHYDDLWKA